MIKAEEEEVDSEMYFEEMEIDAGSWTTERHNGSELDEVDQVVLTKSLMKKAEVQYKGNVESFIQELEKNGRPLEVTHNVSLDEVKKNLKSWVEPSKKEYINLP